MVLPPTLAARDLALDACVTACEALARMTPSGAHLLVECLHCAPGALADAELLETALRRAASAVGARVVTSAFHRFSPQGVTGFLLLEESHLSIHTWPERGYAAVDLYTCGAIDPDPAVAILKAALAAERVEVLRVRRGQLSSPHPLTIE